MDRDQVIREALGNIKIYVENGKNEGFVQLMPPQLTRFQSPAEGQNLMESDGVDATAVDRWNQSQVTRVDLIQMEERKQFGKTLTDELTGEQYMLLPIDIDILINPETLTTVSTKEDLNADNDQDDQEEQVNRQTIYLRKPVGPGNQCQKHEFQVPKFDLGFELSLETESKETNDSKGGLALDDITNSLSLGRN